MRTVRITTRNQLLDYIEENPPASRVRRAVEGEGRVRVLGGFASCPPHPYPGWIVLVTSRHGREWPVAVLALDRSYSVHILDEIPWPLWDGQLGRNHPLYDGDDPAYCHRMKERHNV